MIARLCMNGRECGNGKVPPCPNRAIHAITSHSHFPILLCDRCFQLAMMAGLITDPNIGKQEFDRRELKRMTAN